MSIKFTVPTNLSRLKLGEAVVFQGTSNSGVTKVELLADEKFKLGETGVSKGTWTINYENSTKKNVQCHSFSWSSLNSSFEDLVAFVKSSLIA